MADETLQHHHQAPRPLAERAVWVLLQEGKELRSDLGQHRGHVVSSQRVAVVQIHHCILQVAEQGHRGTETLDNDDKGPISRQAHTASSTVGMSRKEIVKPGTTVFGRAAGPRMIENNSAPEAMAIFALCGENNEINEVPIKNLTLHSF